MGRGYSIDTAVAGVAAVTWIQSLAWELLHAMGVSKQTNKQTNKQNPMLVEVEKS